MKLDSSAPASPAESLAARRIRYPEGEQLDEQHGDAEPQRRP